MAKTAGTVIENLTKPIDMVYIGYILICAGMFMLNFPFMAPLTADMDPILRFMLAVFLPILILVVLAVRYSAADDTPIYME